MGKYARMRLWHLKEHQPALYTSLLFSGKLNEHLSEIETSAQAMMKSITNRLKQECGITEELKATDQRRRADAGAACGTRGGLIISCLFSPISWRRTAVIIVGLIMIGIGWYKRAKYDKEILQCMNECGKTDL